MGAMLTAAALVTFYFHGVLGSDTVFTHLFYIPIIFGALWWGRRGIAVPVLLGLFLLTSQWLFRQDYYDVDDFFRAAMFVIVSWVVILLRERILATEAALERKSAELQKRVQALSCLHAINRLRESPDMGLDDIFKETARLLTQIGFEDARVRVRIAFQGRTFAFPESGPAAYRIANPILTGGRACGELDVSFAIAPAPDSIELANACELVDNTARRLGKIIEHEHARAELDRYHLRLEELVRERTDELIVVNRRLREEIAQREKANDALRESENKYRLLFENASEAIFIAQDGAIRFANPALGLLGGYSADHLLKTPMVELIHPADRQMVAERHRQRMAGLAPPASYAFRIRTADGASRWVEINAVLFQWQGRPATLNYLRDITDRQQLAASIGHMQKMESLGALAGGIAHKFNNALTGITGNIELLKFSFPDNPALQRYTEAAFRSVQEMTGLIQQLLAYARGGKYQSRTQSLLPLIRDVALLTLTGGDKQIDLETALSADIPEVEIDAVQMRMVLLAILNKPSKPATPEDASASRPFCPVWTKRPPGPSRDCRRHAMRPCAFQTTAEA